MSRYCGPNKNVEPILEAAEHWKEVALLSDRGIFEDKKQIWNARNFEALKTNFIDNPIEGDGNFYEKLKVQLAPTQPEVKQLAAEICWFILLCPSNIPVKTKLTHIKTIWEWSNTPFPENPRLTNDVLSGIGSGGRAFGNHLWREWRFFIRLMIAVKQLPTQRCDELLSNDGWMLAEWLEKIPECKSRQLRHMLLFLLFPDNFERIFSRQDRIEIVCVFKGKEKKQVTQLLAWEIDRYLLEIRNEEEKKYGTKELDFYHSPLIEKWKSGPEPSEDTTENVRNLILYGPPGTGKTYQLNKLTKKYFDDESSTSSSKAYLSQELLDVSWFDVIFVVLHGLNGRKGKVSEILKHDYIQMKAKAVGRDKHIRATIWSVLQMHTQEESNIVKFKNRGTYPAVFDKDSDGIWHLVGDWEEECQDQIKRGKRWKNESAQEPFLHQRFEFVTFHQAYSYEDFVEGIRPIQNEETGDVEYRVVPGIFKRICQKAKADPEQRYAIFIDEINRGNIASIFGELITLIEPDKRVTYGDDGTVESGMTLTLPYSGEQFGVPKNLDIYGAMNTADRSIALLDTALRRRFEFEELMPDMKVINGSQGNGIIEDEEDGTIDLRKLLETINLRIQFLLNRDMTIGHSYFINVRSFTDLKKVLLSRIIPLLQEYFYEDWHRIQLVFRDVRKDGEKFEPQIIRHEPLKEEEVIGFDHDDFEDSVKYHVADEDQITPEAVRKVYEDGKEISKSDDEENS